MGKAWAEKSFDGRRGVDFADHKYAMQQEQSTSIRPTDVCEMCIVYSLVYS